MPDDTGRPDLAGKLNLLPQYDALGPTRPLGPGEYVTNSDGSWSNEYSSTVQLGDKWSVVPTLWLRNGKPAILSEDEAAATASKSGLNFPNFPTEQAAESFSQAREAQWQKTPVGRSDMQPPLWTKQQMPDETDLPAWARPKQSGPAAPRAADLPAWARPQTAQDQPRGDPLSSLWESLKGYGAESVAALSEGARALPGEAARVATDIGQALLPGRGGAEAGGRALEDIGDIATFATGGLQNPLGMPRQPQFGERWRGLGTDPRVAQVPQQRALPPPSFAMPGGGPAAAGTAQAPQRLLPAPGNLATGDPGFPPPQQGPRLALPPPTSQVAGAPPVSTGQGFIPQGPGSTARPTFPQSSSLLDPLGPTPMPRPRGEGTATIELRPDVDPVARPGRAVPKAPLAGADAPLGQPSELASSLVSGDAAAVDRKTARRYRKLVGPRGPGDPSYSGLTTQDQRITTAVDSLIEAKDQIRYTDAKGNQLSSGRIPRTLHQFSQGIDYLKSQIFDQYDTVARQITGQGVRVSLQPVVDHLRRLAAEPQIRDLYEGRLAAAAERQAELWERAGSYTPKEMQNVIQHLNAQLKGVMKERETFSYNTMMNQALVTMRQNLNETMMNVLQGPQYQALRNRYGALADIEGDVANALKRQMAKDPLIQQLLQRSVGNISLWVGALHGAGSAALHGFDPTGIAIGTSIKAGDMLSRYLHSPNASVSRIFAKRAYALDPTVSQRLSLEMGTKIGEIRQRAYDANVSGNIAEVQRLGNQRRNLSGF